MPSLQRPRAFEGYPCLWREGILPSPSADGRFCWPITCDHEGRAPEGAQVMSWKGFSASSETLVP